MLMTGPTLLGLYFSSIASSHLGTPQTLARTTYQTKTIRQTRLVTMHIRGRVIRRHDHYIVVVVPRTIFHTRTHRIVVPRHTVRIRNHPGLVSAVVGVAPPPVTVSVPYPVTVPVTVTVPGPTTTVISPPVTVTVPTTVTVTVPLETSTS
jgi:hypothetical protein